MYCEAVDRFLGIQIVHDSAAGTLTAHQQPYILGMVSGSAYFLAETSVRSPRKIIIFIIYKNIFWIKVSNKYFI